MKDHLGRPLVAVTGIGLVTPLAWGREANWAAITAGKSGISRIRRFPVDKRTTIAGTVDCRRKPPARRRSPPSVERGRRGGRGSPGAIGARSARRLSRPDGRHAARRMEPAAAFRTIRQANSNNAYTAITRVATGRTVYETFLFGGVGERLAAQFGTRGAPIALTTACATGASAIRWRSRQSSAAGRCGDRPRCRRVGAAGGGIRFSLSALTARNDARGASAPSRSRATAS